MEAGSRWLPSAPGGLWGHGAAGKDRLEGGSLAGDVVPVHWEGFLGAHALLPPSLQSRAQGRGARQAQVTRGGLWCGGLRGHV